MNESEIKRRCAVRGWCYNTCSAYLIESGVTPYQMAKLLSVSRSVVWLWIHSDKLSSSVQFLFLLLRKIFLRDGSKVTDWF